MSEINDTPAFPTSNWQKAVPMSSGYSEGMSMRDYFAAKALQGVLASANLQVVNFGKIARDSYAMADAMLIVRAEDE